MPAHSVESLLLRYSAIVGGMLVLFAVAAGFAGGASPASLVAQVQNVGECRLSRFNGTAIDQTRTFYPNNFSEPLYLIFNGNCVVDAFAGNNDAAASLGRATDIARQTPVTVGHFSVLYGATAVQNQYAISISQTTTPPNAGETIAIELRAPRSASWYRWSSPSPASYSFRYLPRLPQGWPGTIIIGGDAVRGGNFAPNVPVAISQNGWQALAPGPTINGVRVHQEGREMVIEAVRGATPGPRRLQFYRDDNYITNFTLQAPVLFPIDFPGPIVQGQSIRRQNMAGGITAEIQDGVTWRSVNQSAFVLGIKAYYDGTSYIIQAAPDAAVGLRNMRFTSGISFPREVMVQAAAEGTPPVVDRTGVLGDNPDGTSPTGLGATNTAGGDTTGGTTGGGDTLPAEFGAFNILGEQPFGNTLPDEAFSFTTFMDDLSGGGTILEGGCLDPSFPRCSVDDSGGPSLSPCRQPDALARTGYAAISRPDPPQDCGPMGAGTCYGCPEHAVISYPPTPSGSCATGFSCMSENIAIDCRVNGADGRPTGFVAPISDGDCTTPSGQPGTCKRCPGNDTNSPPPTQPQPSPVISTTTSVCLTDASMRDIFSQSPQGVIKGTGQPCDGGFLVRLPTPEELVGSPVVVPNCYCMTGAGTCREAPSDLCPTPPRQRFRPVFSDNACSTSRQSDDDCY